MGDIGTERREVEFQPLPEEASPTPRRDADVEPAPAVVSAYAGPEAFPS